MIELAQDAAGCAGSPTSRPSSSAAPVGVVAEDELSPGKSFRNFYEQTKFEAELLVRRAMGQLPLHVLRPPTSWETRGPADRSHSKGPTPSRRSSSPANFRYRFPCRGRVAPFNVVPIDFVVDAAPPSTTTPARWTDLHVVDRIPPARAGLRAQSSSARQEACRGFPRVQATDRLLKSFPGWKAGASSGWPSPPSITSASIPTGQPPWSCSTAPGYPARPSRAPGQAHRLRAEGPQRRPDSWSSPFP